jgi:hypothetical protein
MSRSAKLELNQVFDLQVRHSELLTSGPVFCCTYIEARGPLLKTSHLCRSQYYAFLVIWTNFRQKNWRFFLETDLYYVQKLDFD